MPQDHPTTTEDLVASVYSRIRKEPEEKVPDHSYEVSKLSREAGMPLRHQITVIQEQGPWYEAMQTLQARIGSGFLVALVSERGTGKTQLAVELIKAAIGLRMKAKYCTATEFLLDIKATYKQDADRAEKDVLLLYRKPKLLVIDEFSKRKESEWEFQLLFELINRRYNDLSDTLLISNQTASAFKESIGASLASRMAETGGIIECNWESFRK